MTINASQATSFFVTTIFEEIYNAGANYEKGGSVAGGRTSILTWTAVCGCFKVNFKSWQLISKISRVGRPEDVIFAVKKMEATSAERFVTKNVVYREVLLHRRHHLPLPQVEPAPNPILLPTDQSADFDYNGIYDNIGGEEKEDEHHHHLSASLPSNITLAPLPTAREAEVSFGRKYWIVLRLLMPPGCRWHGEHCSSSRGLGGHTAFPP